MPESSHATNAVPSCAALAPSLDTAAMPAPSMTPPAAMIGRSIALTSSRVEREGPERVVIGVRVEDAAVAARFEALGDQRVHARGDERPSLDEARGRAEQEDAGVMERAHALRRRDAEVEAHDPRLLGHEHREHLVVVDEAAVDLAQLGGRARFEPRELGAQALEPPRLASARGRRAPARWQNAR